LRESDFVIIEFFFIIFNFYLFILSFYYSFLSIWKNHLSIIYSSRIYIKKSPTDYPIGFKSFSFQKNFSFTKFSLFN
jgi:hypothetical protein